VAIAAGIVGAGVALIAGIFALFVFGYACEGTDVAAPPSEGTAGDALCASGVPIWDAALWLVVAGLSIAAIPRSIDRRNLRPMALVWLAGIGLLAVSIALSRIVDAGRESI
jgi:hypothetical protein